MDLEANARDFGFETKERKTILSILYVQNLMPVLLLGYMFRSSSYKWN